MSWHSKRSLAMEVIRLRSSLLECIEGQSSCSYFGHTGDRDLVDPQCPGLYCHVITALGPPTMADPVWPSPE